MMTASENIESFPFDSVLTSFVWQSAASVHYLWSFRIRILPLFQLNYAIKIICDGFLFFKK
jgi:hypothetical protein